MSIKRRAFLRAGRYGLGLVALNSLLNPSALVGGCQGRGGQDVARRDQSAALRAEGEARDLSVPGRRPVASRNVRLQAAARRSWTASRCPNRSPRASRFAQLQGKQLKCFAPQFGFKRFGKCGRKSASCFRKSAASPTSICIVRSMWTEQINHDPAHMFMNTGSIIAGRPSMGSWMFYGLGSESQDLPGFVVHAVAGPRRPDAAVSARQWSSGFLPSKFQGIKLNSFGDPVLYIDNPQGIDKPLQQRFHRSDQRARTKALHRPFRIPRSLTRIAQYEMAFRMQTSVPELVDMSKEPAHVLEMYGAKPGDGSFASNCLLARRLAERGVRFIQLYHRDWDHHEQVKNGIEYKAEEVDQPTAALIKDLKERGMLDDTLIILGGEFGRTPMAQGHRPRSSHQDFLVHVRRRRFQAAASRMAPAMSWAMRR